MAVIAIGVIIALYDRGILPLAGPFVAALVVPLILRFRRRRLAQQRQRLAHAAADELRDLLVALEQERSQPPPTRASGASDLSLSLATTHIHSVLAQLAAGHVSSAADQIDQLSGHTAQGWTPGTPLSVQVDRVLETGRQLAKVTGQLRSAPGSRNPG